MLKVVVFLAAASVSSATALSATLTCEKKPGFLDGPFVATPAAATQIFIIAAQWAAGRKPIESQIHVEDRGRAWGVWESSAPSGSKLKEPGGGLLQMRIDKCDGRISEVHHQK